MKNSECSISNIYRLDGRVPLLKAVPFGLQHILAMFVSNLTPITIIAAAGGLSQAEVAVLLQNAMLVAGIATLIQLFPVWRIGSRLPIVMGVSFTFVTVLSTVAASYGYPAVIGAVICGGIFEGVIGLFARYWRKIIAPVVASSVVIAIGYSLFTVGARSFGGGYAEDFGSASNLLLGTVTLAVCLGWNILARGYLKQRSVLAGLVVGIYPGGVYGQGGSVSDLFRGNRFPASASALCTGIPYGSHFFRCYYLYGFCGRNHPGTRPPWSLEGWAGRSPQRRFLVPWPATALLPSFLPCLDALR